MPRSEAARQRSSDATDSSPATETRSRIQLSSKKNKTLPSTSYKRGEDFAFQETWDPPPIERPKQSLEAVPTPEKQEVSPAEIIRRAKVIEDAIHIELFRELIQSRERLKTKDPKTIEQLKEIAQIEERIEQLKDRIALEHELQGSQKIIKQEPMPGREREDRQEGNMRSPKNDVAVVTLELSTGQQQETISKSKIGEGVVITEDNQERGVIELTPQRGYLREWLAGFMDKILSFNIVPPTVIREIKGNIGSLQVKVEGKPAIISSSAINIDDMQKMAVIDYLLYNIDRHLNNFLVSPQGSAWAIDHGLILPSPDLKDIYFRSFALRYCQDYNPILSPEIRKNLAKVFTDDQNPRYKILLQAFILVFGPEEGEMMLEGCKKRALEMIGTKMENITKEEGRLPEYHLVDSDEKDYQKLKAKIDIDLAKTEVPSRPSTSTGVHLIHVKKPSVA